MLSLLNNFLLFLAELAALKTDEDVFVATTWSDVVSHNHLGVLLGPHAQVHEVTVALVQLLQSLFGLHHEIGNQSSILHSRDFILRVRTNGDTYSTNPQLF